MLGQNLKMVEAVCGALDASPVAHVVYVSSDAVYVDDANPVSETSCCQPSSLHATTTGRSSNDEPPIRAVYTRAGICPRST